MTTTSEELQAADATTHPAAHFQRFAHRGVLQPPTSSDRNPSDHQRQMTSCCAASMSDLYLPWQPWRTLGSFTSRVSRSTRCTAGWVAIARANSTTYLTCRHAIGSSLCFGSALQAGRASAGA